MKDIGIIIKTHGDLATVQMVRSKACDSCKACDAFGQKTMRIIAFNEIHAQEGDRVEFEIQPQNVYRHTFLIFIFPLLMMIAGYLIGISLTPEPSGEGAGILGAAAFFGLSFLVIKKIDRHWGEKHKTSARIIRQSTDTESCSIERQA